MTLTDWIRREDIHRAEARSLTDVLEVAFPEGHSRHALIGRFLELAADTVSEGTAALPHLTMEGLDKPELTVVVVPAG